MPHYLSITPIGLAMLPLMQQASGWDVDFWSSKPTCTESAADTSRGGPACWEQTCNLVAIGTIKSMLISKMDDGCTLSLYGETTRGPCYGDTLWERSKEDLLDDGDYDEEGGYSCQQGLDNLDAEVAYFSYTC